MRLLDELAAEPDDLVLGPIASRIEVELRSRPPQGPRRAGRGPGLRALPAAARPARRPGHRPAVHRTGRRSRRQGADQAGPEVVRPGRQPWSSARRRRKTCTHRDEWYHEIRKAAKRLRYAAESVAPAFGAAGDHPRRGRRGPAGGARRAPGQRGRPDGAARARRPDAPGRRQRLHHRPAARAGAGPGRPRPSPSSTRPGQALARKQVRRWLQALSRQRGRWPTNSHPGASGPRWSPLARGGTETRVPAAPAASTGLNRPVRCVSCTTRTVPSLSRSRNAYSVCTQLSDGSGSQVHSRYRTPRPACGAGLPPTWRRSSTPPWSLYGSKVSPWCRRARTPRSRPAGSARTRSVRRAAGRPRWSCSRWRRGSRTASKVRPRRTVRMSPWTCSHSGLSRRDTASMLVGEVDEGQGEAASSGGRRCVRRRCPVRARTRRDRRRPPAGRRRTRPPRRTPPAARSAATSVASSP